MLSIGLLFLDRTRCKYHSSIRRECRQVRGTSSWDQHHNCAYEEDDVWILLHRNRLPIFIPSPHACAGCTWSLWQRESWIWKRLWRGSARTNVFPLHVQGWGVSWHNFLRPTVVNKAGGAADQSGPFSNFWSVENGTYFAFCTVREEDKLLSYLQYHLASGDASVLTELHFFFSLIGAYPACEQSIAFIGV